MAPRRENGHAKISYAVCGLSNSPLVARRQAHRGIGQGRNDPNGQVGALEQVDVATENNSGAGRHWRDIQDFDWLPDGSGFLVAALDKTGAPIQLWILTYPGGAVHRIFPRLERLLVRLAIRGWTTIAACSATSRLTC